MAEENLKDKAARGIIWSGISNGSMQVLNAVFGIVVSRILTQDDFGLVGMLTIFSTLASAVQESGFVSALTNRRNATYDDYNSVFWFNVISAGIMYVILWFSAPLIAMYYHEPRLIPLSRYAFIGFFIASFSTTPRAILFKNIRAKEQTFISILALVSSGLVGLTMALCGMSYWGIATQSIVFVTVGTIATWHFSRWRPSLKFTFKPVREMFGFSSKMLVTNIFNCVNNNVFTLVLGNSYKPSEVGSYTQANKWNTMGSQFITGIVQGVAQPTFVQVGRDSQRLRQTFRKMLRFTSFISFPLMFLLLTVAPEFITFLLTDKWLSSARYLQALCVSGAFLPITALYYNFIISRGKSSIYMGNIIVQGCVQLLMLFSIMRFHLEFLGMTGIRLMITFYVSLNVLWLFIWHYFLWREIRLPLFSALKDVLPFMLIAIVSSSAAYFATTGIEDELGLIISRAAISLSIYVGLLWITHATILRESLTYLLKRKKHKK